MRVKSAVVFGPAWERIKEVTGWTKWTDLSTFLKIDPGSVSTARRRNLMPLEWPYQIHRAYGVSLDWLISEEPETMAQEAGVIAERQGKYRVAGRDIDVAPEHESVFRAFAEVMASNYEGVKIALTQNTFVFQEAVQNAERIEKLESDIEAIKRHLMPRETDFKSQGQHGEEKNAGGGEH